MEILKEIFATSLIAGLFLIAIQLLLIWLFIKSAITSGVKSGIIKAYEEIEKNKKNPPPTEKELLEQEIKAWE